MITGSDVREAGERIAGWVRRTPVVEVEPDAFAPTAGTWLKLELLQHTGSFKARGAFNRVLAARESGNMPVAGVVTASGGNAGLAYAYAAAATGARAEVFVPQTAPAVKVARLCALGAHVVQVGTKYADAYEAAAKRAADTGALFGHAYDQPEVCAGQGTIALELLKQTDGDVDTVLVATGGGGLMAGLAAALEGRVSVVAVEPRNAPTLYEALRAGAPVDVAVSGVAADALGATRIGEIAFDVARRTGVESVLVEDHDIVAVRRALWDKYRVVAEHSSAAAAAALSSGAYRPQRDERVAVLLCGANTDPSDLV
ncbi:threonine/serine dehydratase [Wenjunlia tyrosinilytica]|uniref:Threonine dehydratase n=1 Tax=Wenjunlia tyrosinilytica TaxID=1544741 RepID=A0A918DVY5_9ACTN|nr:threonine/serine dehydratase [Wenjunlia tyrosinilytica]GGO84099.1 threonine dehydratase [Wenjunlia tyrosinilytica]